jgi:XTP/dITP diphosphohydrolase
VVTQAEAGLGAMEIDEDGATFEENSMKKAKAVSAACGLPAVADDSGLEADALSGRPGIYSARFAGVAGEGADEANNRKLLSLLEGVPDALRTGRYVSVVTLAFPDGRALAARGECEGTIGRAGAGEGGFGYDPLFTPAGCSETFAQLPPEAKNRISHRAKAMAGLRRLLEAELGRGQDLGQAPGGPAWRSP